MQPNVVKAIRPARMANLSEKDLEIFSLTQTLVEALLNRPPSLDSNSSCRNLFEAQSYPTSGNFEFPRSVIRLSLDALRVKLTSESIHNHFPNLS